MRLLKFGKKWVLFCADNGVGVVMYRPLARKLALDPRVRQFHAMHLKRVRLVDTYEREHPRQFFAKYGIQKGITNYKLARLLPVDLFVTPNFSEKMHCERARRKVQIFHGVSFKNYCIKDKVLRYDRLFLPGPYHRRRFIEAGLFKEGDERLLLVGLPKLDRLVDGSLDRRAILEELRLDPARRTVLYAPTGDRGNSLFRQGEELLAALFKLPVNLIVKPHDHADRDERCTIDWPARLRATRRENFAAVLHSDVVPLLYAADLLITDASSVAFEYTLLDRPVVFIDVPEIIEGTEAPMMDLSTWGRKGGDIVRRPSELEEVVPRLLENPGEKSAIRRAIAADLFFEPGKATQNAVSALYRELELEPPPA